MEVAVTLTEWLNWVSNEGSGERKILALASGKKRSPGHKRANDILALNIINFLSRAMKADNSSAAALPLSARSFVQLSVSPLTHNFPPKVGEKGYFSEWLG